MITKGLGILQVWDRSADAISHVLIQVGYCIQSQSSCDWQPTRTKSLILQE